MEKARNQKGARKATITTEKDTGRTTERATARTANPKKAKASHRTCHPVGTRRKEMVEKAYIYSTTRLQLTAPLTMDHIIRKELKSYT